MHIGPNALVYISVDRLGLRLIWIDGGSNRWWTIAIDESRFKGIDG